MAKVFERPKALCDVNLHYCPGCTHGMIHRLVAEVIDELEIEGKTVGIAPVGCVRSRIESQAHRHRQTLRSIRSRLQNK